MQTRIGSSRASVLIILLSVLGGCGGTPDAVEVPAIDPQKAAKAALDQYDSNHDGQLSSDELSSCPALRKAAGNYDANNNKMISEEELADRFARWVKSGIGVSSFICQVNLDGRPFPGAEVKLVPEAFLSDWVQVATGTTDQKGIAVLAIDSKHLPGDMQEFRGVHQGLFKVIITHPSTAIPSKYNTETTLGREISFETGEDFVTFKVSRS